MPDAWRHTAEPPAEKQTIPPENHAKELIIGGLRVDNWVVMAPMAGITNLPFRSIAKKMMAGLVTTEMVSAAGLVRGQKPTLAYLKTNSAEQPLAVQIFGSDPDEMAAAASIAAESGAALVDLNMGCPARKVVKTGAGSALLKDRRRAEMIVAAVRHAIDIPLTVKIRSGWSPGEMIVPDFAHMFENSGVDAITLHPRFATQGFSGAADWTLIRSVVSAVQIPVIGNGDVVGPQFAFDMRKTTGCKGVMIGRGAVGNPWIFQHIWSLEHFGGYQEPTLAERKSIILEHHRLLLDQYGSATTSRLMRGLMLWYTKNLPYGSRFRGAFTGIQDLPGLIRGLDAYFKFLQENKI
jgi:tRNA-dihydrouridine synthase B